MPFGDAARKAAIGARRSKAIFGPPEGRFWAKVDKTETCWNWTAAINPGGYGMFFLHADAPIVSRHSARTVARQAHQFSYELTYGPIPSDDLQLDHICHNRRCVNPEHLRSVTRKQNQENRTGAQRNSKSGVRGVRWREQNKHSRAGWVAQVQHNGKIHHVGRFDKLADAEAAVVAKRLELFSHSDGR